MSQDVKELRREANITVILALIILAVIVALSITMVFLLLKLHIVAILIAFPIWCGLIFFVLLMAYAKELYVESYEMENTGNNA